MADHSPTGPVELGTQMDYAEHDRTYHGFLALAKYGSLFCAGILIAMAFGFSVEKGAGQGSRITDQDFAGAGAAIGKAGDAAKADVVLKVRRPTDAELKTYKSGAAVIAIMDPYGNDAAVAALAKAGVTAF